MTGACNSAVKTGDLLGHLTVRKEQESPILNTPVTLITQLKRSCSISFFIFLDANIARDPAATQNDAQLHIPLLAGLL